MENNIILTEGIKSPVPLSTLERQMCELYSSGQTKKEIAIELGVTPRAVDKLLKKDQVAEFVSELIFSQKLALKSEKLRTMGRIAEAKLERIEEDDSLTFAEGSCKDVIDILKTMDDIQKEEEKKKLGITDNATYINILNTMMDK